MRLRSVATTRIVCFDLESRPAAYWFDGATTARITAIAWKWTDEPDVHTLLLRPDGKFDRDGRGVSDTSAYTEFRGVLTTAGLVFGHNIRQFDLPLFQAGLLRRELPTLERVLTTDTLKDYPKRKDMSASLENLAIQHGVDTDGGKKHMAIVDWERANMLTPDGRALARERVVSDVLLQERLRARLLELGLLKAPRMWTP